MRNLWMVVVELLIAAVTVLLVGGAEARRLADTPSGTGPAPFGTYECWPAEESATPDLRA